MRGDWVSPPTEPLWRVSGSVGMMHYGPDREAPAKINIAFFRRTLDWKESSLRDRIRENNSPIVSLLFVSTDGSGERKTRVSSIAAAADSAASKIEYRVLINARKDKVRTRMRRAVCL